MKFSGMSFNTSKILKFAMDASEYAKTAFDANALKELGWDAEALKKFGVDPTILSKLAEFPNMKFDPIKFTEKIPVDSLRRKAMDVLLTVGIPFNRWLGMRLDHLDTHKVRVISPPAVLRRNHVGSAHACSLALLGEYPAGLIVAQKYPSDKFRMIISSLNIEYSKQGRGVLYGEALAPDNWPDLIDDEGWIEMKTEITNEKAETIAICKTTWQVKSWDRIERDRTERGQSQKN